MPKIATLSPTAKEPQELEDEFEAELWEVINKYFKAGMTAKWQQASLADVCNQLLDPTYAAVD